MSARCDQCEPVSVNGVPTHEQGCPNWWKHPGTGLPYEVGCKECGTYFVPEDDSQKVCESCVDEYRTEARHVEIET